MFRQTYRYIETDVTAIHTVKQKGGRRLSIEQEENKTEETRTILEKKTETILFFNNL